MGICEKCGLDVKKLTVHAETRQHLCLKCISQSGFLSMNDDEIPSEEPERRSSIRIPLTVTMNFGVSDDNGQIKKYPAYSVDISMTGMCFVWEACMSCKGYMEGSIDEDCIFFPYFRNNPTRRTFAIELKITDNKSIIVDAYAAHTTQDKNLGQEYVGAQFNNLSNQHRRIIEKMIISG